MGYVLSGYKTRTGRMIYLGCCGVAGVIGGSVMGFSREVFLSALSGAKGENERITEAFVDWSVSAFDQFAMIAMVIVFSTVLAVFIASRCDPDNRIVVLREPSRVVLAMQCFLAIVSVIYCINLVNPLFYVAGYITRFTLGGMALLFVGYMISDTARKGLK